MRITPLVKRVGISVTAGALVSLGAAWAVYAASIKPAHIPTTAKAFATQECDGPFSDLAAGEDGWHFVVPQSQGNGFISLSLTFQTANGEVAAGPISSTDASSPDAGAGWNAWLDDAPAGVYRHAYVITTAGWTLTAANAEIVDEKNGAEFNLSHTCSGTPATPSPAPSESPSASPSASQSPSGSASPSPSVSESPSESPSPSPSASESSSGSPSPSASASPSSSGSPSASPSVSESASESASPSASASESASPSASPSGSDSASPSPSTGGSLPTTGDSVTALLYGGGLLLALGTVLLFLARNRRRFG